MFSLILLNLTLRDVVSDLPHDFASIAVYTLFALLIGFIWHGSRNKPGSGTPRPKGGRSDV